MRRIVTRTRLPAIALALALLLVSTAAKPAGAGRPTVVAIAAEEAQWIARAQVPPGLGPASGAIARYPLSADTPGFVSPYDGTMGAQGLLLGGPAYYPAVRAWIDWYLRNLNFPDHNGVDGTIYDVWVDTSGQQTVVIDPNTSMPSYDSTDAYAGVFLTLVQAYAERLPGERIYLRSQRSRLDAVARAAIATKHDTGLTGARPDWWGEYLLDNIDTERGLSDYAWLLRNVLGDRTAARTWQGEADLIRRAVEEHLWFADKDMYGWASDQPNPQWGTFYPDAVVQAWPIIFGYGPKNRRTALWASINQAWPLWVTTRDNPGTPDAQPWATLGYAAAMMGRRDQTLAWLAGSQQSWVEPGRPWPWTVNDSAWRARTAALASRRGWLS